MISGIITKIFVQKDDDWGVYLIEDNFAREIKVVGVIPLASLGMSVEVDGKWERTKYGEQLTITDVMSTVQDKRLGVLKYLTDGYVKGCGLTIASRIVDKFGDKTEEILLSDDVVSKLSTVKGIKEKKALDMVKSIQETRGYLPLLNLTNGALTRTQADIILGKYGEKAVSAVKKNPYKLITDIKGFGFKKVDAIACGMGIKKNSIARIGAGMKFILDCASDSDGDCFLFKDDIKTRLSETLSPTPQIPDKLITKQMADNALENWDDGGREKFIKAHRPSADTLEVLDNLVMQRKSIAESIESALKRAVREKYLVNDNDRIYTADMYKRESITAETISHMLSLGPVRYVSTSQIDKSVKKVEEGKEDKDFKITDEQEEAVRKSLANRVSVITGGPGRGKTTIIEVIVDAFLSAGDCNNDNVVMLAPTGRAAQRIQEQTGFSGSTIHRTIYNYKDKRPRLKDEKDWPYGKLVIVDESSMIDIRLMSDLIRYCSYSQVIFVGDVDQIASVGPGNVLKDLIASKVIPTSFLIKGHRNAGSIAENAALINKGREISSYTYDKEFVYIPTNIQTIQQTVINDYITKVNEYGLKDVLLCVAMKERGVVCVKTLNAILQNIFTKGHKEVVIKGNLFREGDRVMQTKNNYQFVMKRPDSDEPQMGVFNGEKGTIVRITECDGEAALVVLFDDGSVGGYLPKSAEDLTLCYATTVHKCQGSEAPCVMMAYTFGDYMLLKRSLFYTGETRAKKEFRFYGEEQWKYGRKLSAFDVAVRRVDDKTRNTSLSERIKQASKARLSA